MQKLNPAKILKSNNNSIEIIMLYGIILNIPNRRYNYIREEY